MKKIFTAIFSFFIFHFAFAQDKPEGLFINSKAYDFKANDQNGHEINFRELRKKGSIVVLFYQGNWSPFCNRELKHFADSIQFILAKNAQLIAITPETQEGIDSTIAKTGANFPIVYDEDMKITTAYQGSYRVDDRSLSRYKNAGIDLLKINNQKKEAYLPIPAVYVVNKEGSVTYRYFNEDNRKRVSVKEILDNLK